MKSKRKPSTLLSTAPVLWPSLKTCRQAWDLFVFSSFLAVIFNAFYVGGIELKFVPKIFHNTFHSTPPSYPGLGKPTPSPKHPSKTPVTIPPATDSFQRLSSQGVYDRFEKKTAVIIDARKAEEYQEGHIPGALNLYGEELDKDAPNVLPYLADKQQEIIVYCHGGDCDLSLMVAKALAGNGYGRVEIFGDGWPAWKKAGYPIQTGATP